MFNKSLLCIALLSLISTVSCSKKIGFKKIFSSAYIYCGISKDDQVHCFNYGSLDLKDYDDNLVLDVLGVPEINEKITAIKMNSYDHMYDKHVIVCAYGYDNKAKSCWLYTGNYGRVKKIALNRYDKFTQAELTNIGFIAQRYTKNFEYRQNDNVMFPALCYANDRKVICYDINTTRKITWNLKKKVKEIILQNDLLCAHADESLHCSLWDNTDSVAWQKKKEQEIYIGEKKHFFSLPDGVICSTDNEGKNVSCIKTSYNNKSDVILEQAHKSHTDKLKDTSISSRSNNFILTADGTAFITNPKKFDFKNLPDTFISLASTFTSYCGVKKGEGSLNCYTIISPFEIDKKNLATP